MEIKPHPEVKELRLYRFPTRFPHTICNVKPYFMGYMRKSLFVIPSLFLRHLYLLSGWFYYNLILCKIATHNTTHNETSDQNRVKQGLLYPTARVEIEAYGPHLPNHGPRVLDHGPLVLA